MGTIILEPITDLGVFSTLAEKVKNTISTNIGRYGARLARDRLTRQYDSQGNVDDITRNILEFTGMMYDRNTSEILSNTGIVTTANTNSGKRNSPRCYIKNDTDIEPGDYILTNYDDVGDTWDEKYLVIEKERHDLNNTTIFFTLYLEQVTS